jgi:hypothetical protein
MSENIMITTDEEVEIEGLKNNKMIYSDELNFIKDKIESMPKFNQIEILRILSKKKEVILNENKYGIHVNLTEVDPYIINELKIYINYVNAQELNLTKMELQKEEFKNIYFAKDNKDINCIYAISD